MFCSMLIFERRSSLYDGVVGEGFGRSLGSTKLRAKVWAFELTLIVNGDAFGGSILIWSVFTISRTAVPGAGTAVGVESTTVLIVEVFVWFSRIIVGNIVGMLQRYESLSCSWLRFRRLNET